MENNNYIINSVNPILYETQETLDFRARIGRRLGLATALYAAISTFCIYKNLSGITMPFFGIITLIYMIYGLKQYDVVIKRSSWFYTCQTSFQSSFYVVWSGSFFQLQDHLTC